MSKNGVVCCISQTARWNLSRLKEKKQRANKHERDVAKALGVVKEFKDGYLELDHPHVEPHLLRQLYGIDSRLFLCWELQFYFEHRWAVKYKDDMGLESYFTILQDPPFPIKAEVKDAAYIPFDQRAIADVQRLAHQRRHSLQNAVVLAHQEKLEKKELSRWADLEDMANERDKEQRHIQERISGERNISDPGWERGIGIDESGKPFTDGLGAHNTKHTKAF